MSMNESTSPSLVGAGSTITGEAQVGLALASDDAELRRLLRDNPMPGRFALTLEREPSFFLAATIEGEVHQTIVVREPGGQRLRAMGSRSVRDAWVNGQSARLGYLSQLRVDPEARDGLAILDILEALETVKDVPFHITTIFENNASWRRTAERNWPGKPTFRPYGRVLSIVLPLWRRRRIPSPPGTEIRRGSAELLPDIAACLQRNYAAYQFAPVWRVEDLANPVRVRGLRPSDFWVALQRGKLVGCLATWDQRSFKQTVVQRYEGPAWRLRPLANLASRVTGWPRLPAPGEQLPHLYVSHLAIDDEDPHIFLSLLGSAYDHVVNTGYAYLALGLGENSPLVPKLRHAFWRIEQRIVLYVFHFEAGAHAADALDDRRPHVELALL